MHAAVGWPFSRCMIIQQLYRHAAGGWSCSRWMAMQQVWWPCSRWGNKCSKVCIKFWSIWPPFLMSGCDESTESYYSITECGPGHLPPLKLYVWSWLLGHLPVRRVLALDEWAPLSSNWRRGAARTWRRWRTRLAERRGRNACKCSYPTAQDSHSNKKAVKQ